MHEEEPMILDDITKQVRLRLEEDKKKISLEDMRDLAEKQEDPREFPFERALRKEGLSYICEVKKASPSKGVIAEDFPYVEIAKDYEKAGASAISCLTERDFFQGHITYLKEIAQSVTIPVLRKDFIIDAYQIYEARAMGAAAVLLICAILDEKTLTAYIGLAHSLGLSALVEAHDEGEVAMALQCGARVIGVNNRNLKDFTVSLHTSLSLRDLVPPSVLFITESGIKTKEDIAVIKERGVHGVLIGETLMKAQDKKQMLSYLDGDGHG